MKSLLCIALVSVFLMDTQQMTQESSLFYLYREPLIKIKQPPLLLLMHGMGSNEEDLFSFADQLPEKFLVVTPRAPYTIQKSSYAWYEMHFENGKPINNKKQAEESRKTILNFIDQLKKKHDFDESQVYLCGFSQGGIMAYSVALTKPDKIAGVGVLSGRLLDETKTSIAPEEQLKKLRVFISHGTQDQVLNIDYARASNAYLKQLHLAPQYKEYPEGHTISRDMLSDFIVWLNK